LIDNTQKKKKMTQYYLTNSGSAKITQKYIHNRIVLRDGTIKEVKIKKSTIDIDFFMEKKVITRCSQALYLCAGNERLASNI
jgi:hypothetical protein